MCCVCRLCVFSVVSCLLSVFTVFLLLFTVYCLPFTIYRLPFTVYYPLYFHLNSYTPLSPLENLSKFPDAFQSLSDCHELPDQSEHLPEKWQKLFRWFLTLTVSEYSVHIHDFSEFFQPLSVNDL